MAFIIGNQSLVLYNEYDLSAYFDQLDPVREGEAYDSTTFGNTSRVYTPGLIQASVEVRGFADPAAGAVNEVLNDSLNSASNILTIANSRADGDDCMLASVINAKFAQESSVSGMVRCSGMFQPSGDLSYGYLLHEPSAETASDNGSAVDGGAASSDGAVAHLHLSAYAGTGNVTVEIEDSPDGSTDWQNVDTFTALGAIGSERRTIAGAIRRYTRAKWTKAAGVTSFTFSLALARY